MPPLLKHGWVLRYHYTLIHTMDGNVRTSKDRRFLKRMSRGNSLSDELET